MKLRINIVALVLALAFGSLPTASLAKADSGDGSSAVLQTSDQHTQASMLMSRQDGTRIAFAASEPGVIGFPAVYQAIAVAEFRQGSSLAVAQPSVPCTLVSLGCLMTI